MPITLATSGLEMPDDFPGEQFNRAWAKVAPLSSSKPAAYLEFSSAWAALSYRYLAAVQHGEDFTNSIISDGTSPPAGRRFHQEKCLFDFFSAGFSALDSFFYAAYALGSLVDAAAFPLATDKDRRNVTCDNTIRRFKERFSSGQPLAALQALAVSPEHVEWRTIRNILTHRAAPGRTLHVSIGSDDETPVDLWKQFDLPLDRTLTITKRAKLGASLLAPMTALADFAEGHL